MRMGLSPKGESGGDFLVGQLLPGVDVYAASLKTGRQLITITDDFVLEQTRFDRQARVNLRADAVAVTQEIYLDYVRSQVMMWVPSEIDALKRIVPDLSSRLSRFRMNLPAKIYLVKTTGQEEGYAAYTRGLDTICLPANMIASLSTATSFDDPLHPADNLLYLEDILNHELFHIFSKNDPERRFQLYGAIHYQSTGKDVQLSDIPWPEGSGWTLPQLKITNPDAPALNVYIEMEVPAAPNAPGRAVVKRALLPLLLARGPYDGGIFFQYLQWQFLAIERDSTGDFVPVLIEDKPLLYESKPLLAQYETLVGRNIQGEIFHPDEVLAQNFVLVSKEPTISLLSTIDVLMSQGAPTGSQASGKSR